jgi:hypothetical protein
MKTSRLAIAFVLAGCGSGSIGSGTDPNGFNTARGSSVLVAGVTMVTFVSTGGGLETPLPTGAACDPGPFVYTVDFRAQTLAASNCTVSDWSDPATFIPFYGVVSLDASQWSNVEAAIAAVTVTDDSKCGADAPSRYLGVAKSAAAITYGDDFYGCLKQYDHYVSYDDLYALQTTFEGLAK